MKPRYFDHNATTPLSEEARRAWLSASEAYWMNPSSPYRAATAVRVRLEAARAELAPMFGLSSPARLVYNSGSTEGNATVFHHWAETLPADAIVGVSPTEHPSVIEAAQQYFEGRIHWLPLEPGGIVDLQGVGELFAERKLAAVSAMAANNETGVLNPWSELADLCLEAGVPYHCDASQWIGKLPLSDFDRCAYVTGSAHKFGGPKGVGFAIVPEGTPIALLHGGAQEAGRRSGTEDVAGIFAMQEALKLSQGIADCGSEYRDAFIKSVRADIPGLELVAEGAPRLWNTVLLVMPQFKSVRWIRALEKRGFWVASGAACATGKEAPSHVLRAMGYERMASERSLRVSASAKQGEADWLALATALSEVYKELVDEAAGSAGQVISI